MLEIKAIRSLVMDYIKQPHSIILYACLNYYVKSDRSILTSLRAVVDATNQIGNQEALEFARLVDPEGHRTVGVLTKCDVVQQGDESRVGPSIPLFFALIVDSRLISLRY